MLNNVDMTSTSGRSNIPMLQFASRENGVWTFGQKKIGVDNDSTWAVNPATFKRGYIAFTTTRNHAGEQPRVHQPANARHDGTCRTMASSGRSSGRST